MKLKLFAFCLCFLMLALPLLAACGGAGGNETKAGPVIDTEEKVNPAEVYDQEVKNLQGHEFYFLVQDRSSQHLQFNEVYAGALTGDKVNDAVFTRNAQLAEKYNCTISEERTSTISSAREVLAAGEYVYDFILCRTKDLRTFSSYGLMVDFFSLENVQLDKAWYSKGFIEGLQIGDHIYYMAGDACTIDDRGTNVIYFNRDILDQNKIGDPYEWVKDGTWTIDKLYETSEACAVDANGDGVWTPGSDDVFGYIAGVNCDYMHVACCGGVYIANHVAPGKFVIPGVIKEEILTCWTKLKPLLSSPHRDSASSGTRFRTNGAAYYAVNMAAVLNWTNYALSFGILPYPKFDESQEKYYTCVGNQVDGSYGIPVTVDNMLESDYKNAGFESGREFVGYFFNAFSYYSRRILTPAFFDEVLKKQMMQDETSAEMLEMTLENKFYDPIYFFDFGSIFGIFHKAGCGNVGYDGVELVTDAYYDSLTSLYNERYSACRLALNKYLEAIDTVENANL